MNLPVKLFILWFVGAFILGALMTGCVYFNVEITKYIGRDGAIVSTTDLDGKLDQKVEDVIDATIPVR